jgi:putative ABC transport system permease protein
MGARLRALLRRLALLSRRTELDRELDEELRFHLEMDAARARAEGAHEDAARREARLRLGHADRLREESRAVFGFPRLEALARDVRLAARRLRRAPGFTAAAVATLALGISATTALFAIVDAVLLRALPYPAAERLVAIVEMDGGRRSSVAPANVADYRTGAIESLAAWHFVEADLSEGGRPESLVGHAVGADFFGVLGKGPVHGRAFLPEEDREGGPRVVILSDGLWRSRFAADPAIVGRSIRLDRQPTHVVGVMPPDFVAPGGMAGRPISLLLPAAFPAELLSNRGDHETNLVARLRPGASVEQARAELGAVSERLAREFPDTNREVRAEVVPLDRDLTRSVRGSMLLLFGAVLAVLAIACLNVANLQVVRALGRGRELAIAGALGAGRARLAAGLVIESLLLALLGGASGVGLARVLLDGLKALAPAGTPRLDSAALDWRVLAVALAVTLATGVAFGLLPALTATRSRPFAFLAGGREPSSRAVLRWRGTLVSAQVALALALLVAAGLLVRSMARLHSVPLGFETGRVVAARVMLPPAHYPDAARRLAFFEELERRLAARPGVEAVAFANALPLRGGWSTGVEIEGRPARRRAGSGRRVLDDADAQAVSPGYFHALGIPHLAGRGFEPGDREGAPCVALVNQDFVRLYSPERGVLGRRFRRGDQAPWIEVVGIVGSLRRQGPDAELTPQIYLPAAQIGLYPVRLADVALRGAGGAEALAALLRAEVTALDPEQPLSRVMSLDEALERGTSARRFGLALFSGFALVALALTLVGIYGVAAYAVSQRTAELGVRIALGAGRERILGLVARDVLAQLGVGIAIGAGLAVAGARALGGLLFEVTPNDPGTFALIAPLVALAGMLAALGPALRATRVDPVTALRWE